MTVAKSIIIEVISPEALARRCSAKNVFLKISQNSQENTVSESLFQAFNFIKKETQVQVFFCEFSEFFKNIFFIEHLWQLPLLIERSLLIYFFLFFFFRYQMLYADSYLTKDEFYQMFDHKGYESLRGKYRCDDALPTIYDKVNRKARR